MLCTNSWLKKYFSERLSSDSALFQHCSALQLSQNNYYYNIYYIKCHIWSTFMANSAVTQQCWVLKIYINTLSYNLYKILQKNQESHKWSRRSSVLRYFYKEVNLCLKVILRSFPWRTKSLLIKFCEIVHSLIKHCIF